MINVILHGSRIMLETMRRYVPVLEVMVLTTRSLNAILRRKFVADVEKLAIRYINVPMQSIVVIVSIEEIHQDT